MTTGPAAVPDRATAEDEIRQDRRSELRMVRCAVVALLAVAALLALRWGLW
ncbi:hypothetical protein [Nakamurella endophytica]|uniref:Uncharacterized protein n=1 Tax=Nakamurella endophytica TaxID=1748367 RepID=A0A917WMS4_9ACTN|nr:hypothetical protein [Nakamurella endophytica]GGM17050.1 hypothetical protein GCM10011594_41420 [Nakamurella endophytica]